MELRLLVWGAAQDCLTYFNHLCEAKNHTAHTKAFLEDMYKKLEEIKVSAGCQE
jgi:hypothetical protein